MTIKIDGMKHKLQFLTILFIIMLAFGTCVEPFTPEINYNPEKQIVVEGLITDQTGPFRIRVTRPDNVYNYQNLYKFDPVTDADVFISDQSENAFHLYYTDNGWYETEDKNLRGIVGDTYILHVNDSEGSQYESTPQQISEVADIDSVYYKEEDRTQITGKDVSIEKWLSVYLNTHASSDVVHYFKWEFVETWEFNMPTQMRVLKHVFPLECDCMVDSIYTIVVEVDPEKSHCWISESSKSIMVKSTANNLVGEVQGFPIISIGPGDDRLSIRYSILVKQYVLTKEMYDFFALLRDLNENNGSMYDKNPSPVNSNISCCDNGKRALGYFFASGVKTKRIFINNSDVNIITGHNAYSGCGWEYPPLMFWQNYYYGTISSLVKVQGQTIWTKSEYCSDCRVRGTSAKPDFW